MFISEEESPNFNHLNLEKRNLFTEMTPKPKQTSILKRRKFAIKCKTTIPVYFRWEALYNTAELTN